MNPLSNGINSNGNLLVELTSDLLQAGECQNLEYKPKTSRYVDDQNYYYYGLLENSDTNDCNCQSGEIMLEAVGGLKYGYIRANAIQYEIHAINCTYSLLGKVELSYYDSFDECFSVEEPESRTNLTPELLLEARDGFPCEIKVLFLYTSGALATHTAFELNNISSLAISQTNQALQNSLVSNVRASKVASLQLNDFVEDPLDIEGDMAALIGFFPTGRSTENGVFG